LSNDNHHPNHNHNGATHHPNLVAALGFFLRGFIKNLEYIDVTKNEKNKKSKECCGISDLLIKNRP
jgi:hypothetical protein